MKELRKKVEASFYNPDVEWEKVFGKTFAHFEGTSHARLMEMRYLEKIERLEICDKLFIDIKTMYNWLNDILNFAVCVAIQMEMLSIV